MLSLNESLLPSSGWEKLFVLGGVILLALAGWQVASYSAFQFHPEWFQRGESGRIAGRLRIQRLGVSVAVLNGDDEKSLSLGAGLVTGTSPIGGNGNTVIAGHRDIAFRALRNIQAGDIVRIEAIDAKTYAYRVERTRIVNPDDISVLASDGSPKLTMITCYPFYYTGDAPKRYIVDARLIN
ncbi:MAG TPA: class D sortase [Bryobacteraceae bacterium]|nr:class D sortase [Bryobacteraceae bacterium]